MVNPTTFLRRSPLSRRLQAEGAIWRDLGDVAIALARRMPQPLGQVCGPISSGGCGSIEENLKRFEHVIYQLTMQGKNMFNQVPFEQPMRRLMKDRNAPYQLLNGFYLPLFQSGLIRTMYFLHDWQTSHGARWEHDRAEELHIERVYLAQEL